MEIGSLPAFQPSIDERLVKELANLALVADATNVLLLGLTGAGKTYLALSFIESGHGDHRARVYGLVEDLRKPGMEHSLDIRLRVCLVPKALAVD